MCSIPIRDFMERNKLLIQTIDNAHDYQYFLKYQKTIVHRELLSEEIQELSMVRDKESLRRSLASCIISNLQLSPSSIQLSFLEPSTLFNSWRMTTLFIFLEDPAALSLPDEYCNNSLHHDDFAPVINSLIEQNVFLEFTLLLIEYVNLYIPTKKQGFFCDWDLVEALDFYSEGRHDRELYVGAVNTKLLVDHIGHILRVFRQIILSSFDY